jgi:hypothetical protein
LWELEGTYPGSPCAFTGHLYILGGVPEGAVVCWVYHHLRVVAPASARAGLRACARDKGFLTLRHLAKRVGNEPARVADRWVHGCAGGAETYSNVALVVHGYAAHPAVRAVAWRVCALLEDRGGSVGAAHFIPAHACYIPSTVYGVVRDKRLMCTEIPVHNAIHQSVADCIE